MVKTSPYELNHVDPKAKQGKTIRSESAIDVTLMVFLFFVHEPHVIGISKCRLTVNHSGCAETFSAGHHTNQAASSWIIFIA